MTTCGQPIKPLIQVSQIYSCILGQQYRIIMKAEERRYLKEGKYSISQSDVLGEGSFGKVYRGYDHTNSKWVAVKQIPLDKLSNEFGEELKKIILSEISIMKKFNKKMLEKPCDFLIQQEDCFRSEKFIFIVMEICEHGTLEDEMLTKRLTEGQCIQILFCLASGLEYMAEMEIVHRDLKPENIFITTGEVSGFEERVYKIGDFGFASQKKQYDIAMGTIPYMAPEMLNRNKYTNSVDVWSLGVIAYQIFFRDLFFKGKDKWEIQENIKKKQFMLQQEERKKISAEFADFLSQCLIKDPQNRINAKDLLSHPLFMNLKQNMELMKKQQEYEKELISSGKYNKNRATIQTDTNITEKGVQEDKARDYEDKKIFDKITMLIFQCVRMRQMAEEFHSLSEETKRQTQFIQMYLLKDSYVMINKITYTVLHKQDYTGVFNIEEMKELSLQENSDLLQFLTERCEKECTYTAGLFNEKYQWFMNDYMSKFEEEDQAMIQRVVNQQPYQFILEEVFEKELNKWVQVLKQDHNLKYERWKNLGDQCHRMAIAKASL